MQVLVYTILGIVYLIGFFLTWFIDLGIKATVRLPWYQHIPVMFLIWLGSPVLLVILLYKVFTPKKG